MRIGWYPGHMHKARREIAAIIHNVDAILEIVDARLPYSSENPLIHSLIADTPCLKVLNKADLADPEITRLWLQHYAEQNQQALALTKDDSKLIRQLPERLRSSGNKKGAHKLFRIMVLGIPNVGKSTMINVLLDRKIARVGNEPAVTKRQQEIQFNEHIALLDTPGILWPKIEDQNSAYRLAASGAIKNTAIEFEDIALYSVDFLRRHYPQALQERYHLPELPEEAQALLEAIGQRRGCLRKGGVDFTKAGEILLSDLRSGKLGRISLESPADIPEPVLEPETLNQT